MTRCIGQLLTVVFLVAFAITQAGAQIERLVIAAGSDEDHALEEINKEQDTAKRLTLYQDFVQRFASNQQAVGYGNWQISQTYAASGDFQKALDYGDKALASAPRDVGILVSQASAAIQAKKSSKAMDYCAKGGEVCHSVGKEAKPEGMSDDDFARKLQSEKDSIQESCDFLESGGLNAIATETNAKNRMSEIEKFTAAFPDSKYGDQISSYVVYTLGPGQLNDQARLVAFGEKMLANDPNSTLALLLLASHYMDSGNSTKAISYAQKVIEVAKADAPDADKTRKVSAGTAHNTIGWAYLNQDRMTAAIPELKAAAALVKGLDDQQYARALYGMGFAYAKENKLTEAREVLTPASKIPGPLQTMTEDLLLKVNRARAKGN
jgi:tetratricopeptide (TPR) repeat protein